MKKKVLYHLTIILMVAVLYGPSLYIAWEHEKNDFLSVLGIIAIITSIVMLTLYQVGTNYINKKKNG